MARVVVFIEGCLIRSVVSDDPEVDVVVLDADIEGSEPNSPQIKQWEGDPYYVNLGVDEVDPGMVDSVFQAVDNEGGAP